jgi:hypothetical protein
MHHLDNNSIYFCWAFFEYKFEIKVGVELYVGVSDLLSYSRTTIVRTASHSHPSEWVCSTEDYNNVVSLKNL